MDSNPEDGAIAPAADDGWTEQKSKKKTKKTSTTSAAAPDSASPVAGEDHPASHDLPPADSAALVAENGKPLFVFLPLVKYHPIWIFDDFPFSP